MGPPLLRTSALRATARPLRALAVVLALFVAGRAGMLWFHRGDFARLGGSELARAFARGLLFDTAAILRYLSVPLVLLVVPVPPRFERAWRSTWGWSAYGISALLVLLIAIDLAYFPYLHRHAGAELLLVREEASGIARLLVTDYLGAVLFLLALCAALFVVWRRWVLPDRPAGHTDVALRPAASWAVVALTVVLVIAGARGTIAGKRLRTTHAFQGASAEEAQLVLNGPFVLWELLERSGVAHHALLPEREAVALARATFLADGDRPAGDAYPLARRGPPRPSADAPPHVVLLVLEGWSADAVDALRVTQGLEPLGATPALDRLAARGRLYTRCFASGQRTNHGYSALLSGLAPSPGAPILTDGLELREVPTLPRIAAAHGYDRTLILGSPRGTQAIEWVAERIGFDRVLAAEDLADAAAPEPGSSASELADGRVLDAVRKVLDGAQRPTLVVVKTQDTHAPYPVAPEAPLRAPAEGARKEFLDVLHASDAALGAFFDRVLPTEAGRRTVFVVVSDHIQRIDATDRVRAPDLFWIPMLVLGPGIAPGVDARVASQTDVLPTLLDLLGWDDVHASCGSSLVSPHRPALAGAVCGYGGTLLRIEEGGWVAHDLETRVDAEAAAPGADLAGIERRLVAVEQVVRAVCTDDRIAPR